MAQRLFLILGIVWATSGIVRYFSDMGDPSATSGAMQSLFMAAVNLVVAWYLFWRKEKRDRAER